MIEAIEEFKLESHGGVGSEYTMNESWAKKPVIRRTVRKRLDEFITDKQAIADRIVKEHQLFYKMDKRPLKYIPEQLGT